MEFIRRAERCEKGSKNVNDSEFLFMHTAKRLEGIGEYYFSQKLREIDELNKQGKNIINLGIGSPDLPPHPEVIEVLQLESAKSNTHAYQNYKGSLHRFAMRLRNGISNGMG